VANDCGSCSVSILLGLGTGSFTSAVNYASGNTNNSRSITSGDFNGDSRVDLVVANYNGIVSILFGDGIGSFAPAVNRTAGAGITSISKADFNGDSRSDIVVSNFSLNNVSVLLNTTPSANFSVPTLNCQFNAITFTNSSSPVYTSWAWVFPGGNPSSSVLQNPIITYSASGTYSAVLTTSNSVGTSGGNIQTFFVTSSPTVTGISSNTLLCSGQTATLTASGANTYSWSPYPGGMFSSSGSSMFTVPPVGTVIYTITGTNTLTGCTNQTTLTQSSQNCTSIENLTQYNNLINAYPNPTKGLITIELNTNSKVCITNALGQLIYNEALSAGKYYIDIKNQSNGIYFMKVLQQDKQQTIKLIKE
jgi:PKD repeat protein